MLTAAELKTVVKTLSQRRAWLKKSLEDTSIQAEARTQNEEALKLLDSAIQKLSASAGNEPKRAAPTRPTVKETGPAKPKTIAHARILVAEDNEDSAQLLMDVLLDMGIKQVDRAKDGMEAFDRIKRAEEPYHIILCDWDMPELSGLQVLGKAKASNTLRGSHFVMVTAMTDAPRIKQAVQQGINDYIAKPVDIDILENKVLTALGLPTETADKQ
ncbi:MAG: response regulator [Agarilytica sp.]